MILQKVFDKTRRITNTSQASLPDTRLFDLVNEAYLYIQRELAYNEIEVFGAISKTDLVAGKPNYQLPDNLLTILRIEINYEDPDDSTKWIKMTESDLGNLPYEWYKLIKNQPKAKPLFDLFANNIWVFPQPNENKVLALRLWYIERQPDFATTEDVLHPVLEKYFDVLASGASYIYFEEIGHPLSQRKFEMFQIGLQKMVSDLKVETLESIKIQVVDNFNSGFL